MDPSVVAEIEETVKDRVADVALGTGRGLSGSMRSVIGGALYSIVNSADTLPPFWSYARETRYEEVANDNDYLGGLTFLATTKLTNIPLYWVAKDPTNSRHFDQATRFTKRIHEMSEYGQGLYETLEKFVRDYLIHDNGGFIEIIGAGDPLGPIVGEPAFLKHLDSMACERTSNPIYPVIYTNPWTGKRTPYHFTRVIYMSQQPNSNTKYNGIGLSSIGRSYKIGEMLVGNLQWRMEQSGARPSSQLIEGQGVSAEYMYQAYLVADQMARDLGMKNFMRKIFIGLEPGAAIRLHSLTAENIDDAQSIEYAHYVMSYSWGFKIQDLWPSGGSRSGDLVAAIQSRGRLMQTFTEKMLGYLVSKVTPPTLLPVYDAPDDDEEQQDANIRDIRSRGYARLAEQNINDAEAIRRQQLIDGNVSREEFIRMQLQNGKLEDGNSVLTLFYKEKDPTYSNLLSLPSAKDPLLVSQNNTEDILEEIEIQMAACYKYIALTASPSLDMKARESLAALEKLKQIYSERAGLDGAIPIGQERPQQEPNSTGHPAGMVPGDSGDSSGTVEEEQRNGDGDDQDRSEQRETRPVVNGNGTGSAR